MNHETHQSKTFAGLLLALSVIVITMGGLLLAARIRVSNHNRLLTLPDGRQVELLGTALGRGTPFTTEKPWHRLARRFLPTRFQNWIPTPVTGSCGTGSNCLTIYLRLTTPSGAPPAIFNAGAVYATETETGFHFPPVGGWCSFGGTPGSQIYGLPLQAYPRRQKDFLFHLVDNHDLPLGTLRIPNPVRGPFPEWRPLPLPQRRTNGPVSATLLGLDEAGNLAYRFIQPKWAINSTSPAWAKVGVRQHTFFDSTGNEGPILSRHEPAWKLRALVSRERPEDFAPDEQLVLTNLSIPQPGNFLSLDQTGSCAGVRLTALVLASTGEFALSNHIGRSITAIMRSSHSISKSGTNTVETWGSPDPFLLVEAVGLQPDDELKFRVFDNEGREGKVKSEVYDDWPGGTRLYKPSFVPPPAAHSVSVQIIVNRPLVFEFMVNPSQIH